MKNLRTWGSMLLCDALVLGVCAGMPLISDLALATEKDKIVEHPVATASVTEYDGDTDQSTSPRELTDDERAFVEKGRQKLMEVYGDDPAQQAGYSVNMYINKIGFMEYKIVEWEPQDYEQRLLDPKADSFWTYRYSERDRQPQRYSKKMIHGGNYPSMIEPGSPLEAAWNKEFEQQQLTSDEQKLLDEYNAMLDAQDEELDRSELRLRKVAYEMLDKLGHHEIPLIITDRWGTEDDKGFEFIFQLEEGTQINLSVSLTTGQVQTVEYGQDTQKA